MELHIFAYCTYFAYDTYIVQVHLIWSEDAVNTDTTSVQRDRRQKKRKRCTMYHGIHTKNEQFYLEAQKALHTCPSLQHCHAESFPISKHQPLLWVPPPARKCVMKRRTLARFHMLIRMPEKSQLDMTGSAEGSFWNQWSALRGTLSPVLWSLTSQCFVSIINSRCNKQKYD